MKQHLLHLTGRSIGLAALVILTVGYALLPASCTLTPEQQRRLEAISVPAASILSTVAVQRGWIEPGDKVTVQRGVAIVTSGESSETKLYRLAEIGLEQALRQGIVNEGDVVELKSTVEATITHPPLEAAPASPATTPQSSLFIWDHIDPANPSLLTPTK